MHIEDRETGTRAYPDHSDEEGHRYRLADTFGTRSVQFVFSMLKGLGKATADHSLNLDFSPGGSDQLAFNAALAVIDGVRPQDEIEAMPAAHMAVTNITLLKLFARTRGAIAGHLRRKRGAADCTAGQAVAAAPWRPEWAIPSRRADQDSDCGAAEIQRIARQVSLRR
jgi:hypothetical protein